MRKTVEKKRSDEGEMGGVEWGLVETERGHYKDLREKKNGAMERTLSEIPTELLSGMSGYIAMATGFYISNTWVEPAVALMCN